MNDKSNKTIIEKTQYYFETTKNFWGILLTIISIGVSVISCLIKPNNIFISISIISCQLIVLFMYIILNHNIKKAKKLIEDKEKESTNAVDKKEEIINELNIKMKNEDSFINDCIVFNKCIDKKTNNFLTLVPDQIDNYYTALENLDLEFDLFDKEELTDEENKKYIERINYETKISEEKMFDLYKRFVIEIIEETRQIIEKYIKLDKHYEPVVITLKLFNETLSNISDRRRMFVYNAFRDKKTYNDTERDIGKRRYTIELNDALNMCMNKESYLRNDIKRSDRDYQNEYFPMVLDYFNSTAVVPVISDYKKDRNYFGFLCCDTLATRENEQIFDKHVTDILYSAALSIGMLIDTLNITWQGINDEEPDFLSTICKKTYIGGR